MKKNQSRRSEMEDRKNRFSKIFGSTHGLMVAILLFVIVGIDFISAVIKLVDSGGWGAFSFISSFFGLVPTSLVALGFLLSYISGKKNEISPAGLMMIRAIIMIRGIVMFIGFVILSIVLLIAIFSFIGYLGELMGGKGVAVVLVMLLILAILVVAAVLNLLYALKVNKLLANIRWYEKVKSPLNVKLIKFMTVLFIVGQALSLIGTIVMMAFSELYMSALRIASGYNEMMDRILYQFFGIGGTSAIMNQLISIVCIGAMIAVYVMVYMMLNKAERFDMMGQNSQQEVPKKENVEPAIDELEEGPTVHLGGTAGSGIQDDDRTVIIDNPSDNMANQYSGNSQRKPEVLYEEPIQAVSTGAVIALSGKESGYRYPVKDGEELIIGKDPRVSHIIVDSAHERISKKHCGIKWNAKINQYQVIDYSTNGTYINSIRKLNKGLFVSVPKGTIINLGKDNVDFKLD